MKSALLTHLLVTCKYLNVICMRILTETEIERELKNKSNTISSQDVGIYITHIPCKSECMYVNAFKLKYKLK